MSQTKPKWDIVDAISRGRQAIELAVKYRPDIENRLKPGEIEDLQSSIAALDTSKSGQSENLVGQKTKTKSKEDLIVELHTDIIDIRKLVKSGSPSPEILMAFGVGISTDSKSRTPNIAAANMIITAYIQYREWAQSEAGILEDDIEHLTNVRDWLIGADETQGKKKFERKAKTVDKNTLQRKVEKLITKISAVGIKTFRSKNPELIPLFESLIPASGNGSDPVNVPTSDKLQPAAANA